jgi:alkanesulfonate monooxygenase SsuD/methylene tetrahydromethanopterin reductase-like flavin-dependent oxidoreductase (luciferase family)
MIAGGGEKVTLKLVARYGDLCNLTDDPATIERKLAVLRKHCADAGRDYASIRKTAMTLCIIGETDAEAAALVPPWAPAVFTGDIARHGLVGTIDTIRRRRSSAGRAAAGRPWAG